MKCGASCRAQWNRPRAKYWPKYFGSPGDEALGQYRLPLRTDPGRLDAVRDLAATATRLDSSR